ncbi:MAG: hypothetical protein ABSH01_04930 [Terriglobia bacterium]|jgi:hypothetical protein
MWQAIKVPLELKDRTLSGDSVATVVYAYRNKSRPVDPQVGTDGP